MGKSQMLLVGRRHNEGEREGGDSGDNPNREGERLERGREWARLEGLTARDTLEGQRKTTTEQGGEEVEVGCVVSQRVQGDGNNEGQLCTWGSVSFKKQGIYANDFHERYERRETTDRIWERLEWVKVDHEMQYLSE